MLARPHQRPVQVIFRTRSMAPAPVFCPTMAVTAWPRDQHGMATKVFTFSPMPAAAATDTPNVLHIPAKTQ